MIPAQIRIFCEFNIHPIISQIKKNIMQIYSILIILTLLLIIIILLIEIKCINQIYKTYKESTNEKIATLKNE